jgi:predicted alpha/beta superfamily hydrolase
MQSYSKRSLGQAWTALRVMLAAIGMFSFFALLAEPASATESSGPLVIGDSFTLDSKVLGETRRINVYLPSPYLAPNARLPVMYMLDGGVMEDFLHVAGLLQVSVDNGTMRPFILVGIENTQRRRDTTGPTENSEDKKIAPVVGGSAAFRTFIRDELMPRVKQRYRTTDETAVVGESLAGLFVVETMLVAPDMFDTYIAFDPSLWWNDKKLTAGADAQLRKMAGMNKTLYLGGSGEKGMEPLMQQFTAVLSKDAPASLHWHYEPFLAETHATIYQPAALNAFRTLFKATH